MGYLFLDYDPSVEIKIPTEELLWHLLIFHETKINELLKRLRATRYWAGQYVSVLCLAISLVSLLTFLPATVAGGGRKQALGQSLLTSQLSCVVGFLCCWAIWANFASVGRVMTAGKREITL